jgi:hypothetical protein
MKIPHSVIRFSGFLFQIRIQKAFRLLLYPWVVVTPQPGRFFESELEVAMLHRPVIAFTGIGNPDRMRIQIKLICTFALLVENGWSNDREAHCIPRTLVRRPSATAGVAEVAK